ncbi:hypothetical protein C7M84_001488 [Penaeus vannamei]|uniref:Uncharacterized protein n=1 Tax=Penaeus vannamei TaxID=6689 RepID=A0A3R7ML84_PENVA|nr:hypothetical protein C7M84_001488 [Penaeus vannamei]
MMKSEKTQSAENRHKTGKEKQQREKPKGREWRKGERTVDSHNKDGLCSGAAWEVRPPRPPASLPLTLIRGSLLRDPSPAFCSFHGRTIPPSFPSHSPFPVLLCSSLPEVNAFIYSLSLPPSPPTPPSPIFQFPLLPLPFPLSLPPSSPSTLRLSHPPPLPSSPPHLPPSFLPLLIFLPFPFLLLFSPPPPPPPLPLSHFSSFLVTPLIRYDFRTSSVSPSYRDAAARGSDASPATEVLLTRTPLYGPSASLPNYELLINVCICIPSSPFPLPPSPFPFSFLSLSLFPCPLPLFSLYLALSVPFSHSPLPLSFPFPCPLLSLFPLPSPSNFPLPLPSNFPLSLPSPSDFPLSSPSNFHLSLPSPSPLSREPPSEH